MSASYETVIGLEIHVQLATLSKAFCADDAAFGGAPNTHTSIISLAHPGTLPRVNKKAVEYAVRLGLALGCAIERRSTFDRKNYFYADLPKGFQTTQQNNPICIGGQMAGVRIHHIHLEEDAGKSLHDQDARDSLIDLNRAGVPLLEIVTEPDLRSADEVAHFMGEMRRLVRWIGVSDGNMEEGSLRCDVNVSIRKRGEEKLGQRCEVKNVNSMRFARRAIEFEVARQIAILESGGRVEQETRGFDAVAGNTYSLREKEEAHDYRYFPEPDLPPVVLSEGAIDTIRSEMPPLPQVMEADLRERFGLAPTDASQLTQDIETARYFLLLTDAGAASARQVSNLVINKLLPWSAESGKPLHDNPVAPAAWGDFLGLIESGQVSSSTAYQRLFPALLAAPDRSPTLLATELNLLQNANSDFLESLADEVLARFPDKVAEYRKGKKGLIGFFMGELMKASRGKAEPKSATRLLEEKLK